MKMAHFLNSTMEKMRDQGLPSKKEDDNVGPEKEGATFGYVAPVADKMASHTCDTILLDDPISDNKKDTPMNNDGFFAIPRSVSNDPRYQGARLKYKHVLHVLMENVAYSRRKYAIDCKIFNIEIGQICISEIQLVNLCNQGVRFKEDKVDKNIVHRAIRFWSQCGYLIHDKIFDKNLLTIKMAGFYSCKEKISKTSSEPQANLENNTLNTGLPRDYEGKEKFQKQVVNHKRTTHKEYNKEDIYKKDSPLPPKGGGDDPFKKMEKEEKIQIHAKVYMTPSQLEDCIKARGSKEAVIAIIENVLSWPGRKYEIRDWARTIKRWEMKNLIKDQRDENKQYGKTLEEKFETVFSGWKPENFRDLKKDDEGILFNCLGAASYIPFFVSYSDGKFKEKVNEFIRMNIKTNKICI